MAADPPGLRIQRLGPGLEHWGIDNASRKNAVHPDALRTIADRCAELRGEVVVLSGANDGPFCAGFDLTALSAALASTTDASAAAPDRVLADATTAMQNADATFIAAARSYVIGAGVELLAACDLRVVDDAAWMLVPAGRLGVVYHAVGLALMRSAFGSTATRTLLLSGGRLAFTDPIIRAAFVRTEPADAVVDSALALAREVGALDDHSRRHHVRLLRALDRGALTDAERREHEVARSQAYAAARAKDAAGGLDT